MAIQGIEGASSLWDKTRAPAASLAARRFSETVSQMATGGGAGESPAGDEETVTLQRTQPDGSILIVAMQGDKVVSTTKIRAPQRIDEPLMTEGPLANPAAGAQAALLDRFNDTSASAAVGTLFSQGV